MKSEKSFFKSLSDGVRGFVKGALVVGLVAAAVGAGISALVGLAGFGLASSFITMPFMAPIVVEGAAAATALMGGFLGLNAGITVGGLAGAVSGVVKGREEAQVSGQDVVNVANMAFAQGFATGHEQSKANPEKAEQTSRKFQQLVDTQRQQSVKSSVANR